jgi:two-component system sensor histidine kinase/response regulator
LDDDRRRATDAGMNAHISKPIEVEELIATLTSLTGRAQLEEVPAGSVGMLPMLEHAAPAQDAPGAPARLPGIDVERVLQRFSGNYGVFVTLLKRFENSQGDAVADARRLLTGGKRQAALQVIHRLRGVAANLGADEIASLAAAAEAALNDGRDAESAALLEALDEAMRVVIGTARALPLPAPDEVPAAPGQEELSDALVQLLALLQNSNMEALTHFRALRPALEAHEREAALVLSDAVETLSFGVAEGLVDDLLKRDLLKRDMLKRVPAARGKPWQPSSQRGAES